MLTYILLPGLLAISIYLVVRWEKMAEKDKGKVKVELDEFEKSLS